MQSKTSWFSKEMMIQSFYSVGWIALIYLAGLLLTLPMRILMIWSSDNPSDYYAYHENLFDYNGEIQLILVFIVPVLLSIFLFRFLQVKNASDFMHSLPIKRTRLYNVYVGMGVIYLVLPVLITGSILMIMNGTMDLENYYSMKDIWSWIGLILLVSLLIFVSGVFVGAMTGMSALQGVLTYILLLLPVGFTTLIFMNTTYFLYGFSPDYYLSSQMIRYSPITSFFTYVVARGDEVFSWLDIILYLIMIIVFYTAGIVVYKKRHLEGVSQAFVFQSLKPFFKYSVTFCVMLLGGMYFRETQHSFVWLIVGYVLGSIIGYLIAEMLLQKTWRVFTHLKGYLLFAVLVAIAIVAFRFDLTGYENRIPELDEVEQVFIGQGVWHYKHKDEMSSINGPEYYQPTLTKKENINSVIQLHEFLVENKQSYSRSYHYTRVFFIAYEMKNGEKVIREYQVPETEELLTYMRPIYEANEFKEKTNRIFHIASEEVTRIAVDSREGQVIIHEPEKIATALEALKTDVKEAPFEEERSKGPFVPSINIYLSSGGDHNEVHLQFESSYEQFEKWLEEENLLDEVSLDPDEIEYAVIAPSKDIDFKRDDAEATKQVIKSPNALKITSKEKIQVSLENSNWADPGNEYVIVFKFKNSEPAQLVSFQNKDVPEFVKEHYEKGEVK
ncbi:DUF6449 domain-containing protein [Pseudalkalibacillus salsuginis]|uniref:DUF6449 domain-containing protein n=1 Tax=Pseudalkalibacillus salsuginis TaxID=2910972 RepID=UPI001F17672A|nr:DUF6449 domain-containing protein [Pseudalkalibacillus salsuginis]MCF6408326.1 DUF6449 domain-containing protein [Pseudalkalibacillus salsuginis]